ncbi:MAG: fumarylacetoacetate hydrolase family protein [Wenzhouxiangella sp.]
MNRRVVDWLPPQLGVSGGGVFPARHVWCVGRNYAEHAREMGADPQRSQPLFFSKPACAANNDRLVVYPEHTGELHHEVELVVAMGDGGRHLRPDAVEAAIFGYAVGVDLTRRDVQARAKQAGHPWEMSKGFDQSAPLGRIAPSTDWQPGTGSGIRLLVNDARRQQGRLGEMIWPVAELIAQLSRTVTLHAGDLVFTGTPAGVGPLVPGDRVRGEIDGLPAVEFSIEARSQR